MASEYGPATTATLRAIAELEAEVRALRKALEEFRANARALRLLDAKLTELASAIGASVLASHSGGTRKLLTQTEICRRLGISIQGWRRWRAIGVAPEPVRMPGRPRWLLSEIEEFERGQFLGSGRRGYFRTATRRKP